MRRRIALVLGMLLVVSACGDDGGGDGPTTQAPTAAPTTAAPTTPAPTVAPTSAPPTTQAPTTQAPTTQAPTTQAPTTQAGEGHPLVIVAIDFAAGFILIRNDGATDYDLTGHWLCNRPRYQELPAEVLAPGEVVEVDAASMNVTAATGELGVYTTNAFDDPGAIVRYVEWGEPRHGRSGTAIAAGIWGEDDFVDNAGANIESIGSNPVSSADWTTTG